ncbi:tyrosine protein phosphatase 3 [Acrodontium crateriforme]|uniref:protein-tyrosine-phosphatase n=1 Tax=Acrodontium crateriforme TaxID=150365 RepID=A0AAQ3M4S5_9PEZI|nr:tyrosine protein phosphatase 3 [Acrodontium crateriforme]
MPLARFHDFAHLTPSIWNRMGWLDQVPRAGELYIGGLHALYQKADLFKEKKITHIVSVIDFDVYTTGTFKQYKSLFIDLVDDPNENLLEHFARTNAFIGDALTGGGAVFVHCAMGKSRSATIVCAYLMWKYNITPEKALAQLCEGRPVCGPNPGFMEQLDVFYEMLQAGDKPKADQIYRKWLEGRFIGTYTDWEKREQIRKAKAKL